MGPVRALLILAVGALAACSQHQARVFTGHADGDYVRVTVALSGSLAQLNVRPGETVHQGEPLFSLANYEDRAQQRKAAERLKAAQAQLRIAQRSAHPEDIRAAQAEVDASQAQLAQLQWRLEQMIGRAPSDGVIVDAPYSEGEWVQAGLGVVSLLSPDNMKIRFFVPRQIAATLRHGQTVGLRCAGCGQVDGEIIYVSPIAEPGDYSSPERLRFLVEARPAPSAARDLRPGQSVDVVL